MLAAVMLVSTGQEVTELGPEDSEDPGVQDAQLAYDTADKVTHSRYLTSSCDSLCRLTRQQMQ